MFMPRTVTEDLVLNGRRMTKGQNVMCSMTAANRDPEAFDDPDTLRFDRKPANSGGLRNMTFGTGRHRCLGANLAQDNLPIMLAGVLGRLKNLRRSEEHTSEPPSLMRISDAVFRLKKNKN